MGWLDGIIDSMDIRLNILRELAVEREAWRAAVHRCLTLCNPMDCSPSGSSVHGDSLGKNTGVGFISCLMLLQY